MAKKHKAKPPPSDPTHVHARNGAGVAICNAAKKDGKPCQSTELDPHNGRCKWHGGARPGRSVTNGAQVVVPWLKLGAWAEKKGDLASTVARLEAQSALPSLDDPVRILQACADQFTELADAGDGLEFRQRALGLLREAMSLPEDERGVAVANLFAHLEGGANKLDALDRVRDTAHMLHTRIEANEKLRLARQNALSFPEALALVASVLEIVARLVPPEIAEKVVLEVKAKTFRAAPQLESANAG